MDVTPRSGYRTKAIEPLVHVDASLDGFFAEIGTLGYLDFFVLFGEFDYCHRKIKPLID